MATLSNGGPPWLMKLQRVCSLSKGNPGNVFNNLGHIIDIEFLRTCFLELDGTKAIGIDKVKKEDYAKNLDNNLRDLLTRIRRGTYTPQPSRITEIPKEDGSKRPLAIACLEDKIVQSAVARILGAVYEPLFLPSSFGFRPGKSCHDALRRLFSLMRGTPKGAIVEIDIRKYFNRVPHAELKRLLADKISDSRFLGLIHKLMVAPTIEKNGEIQTNLLGVPQGSILSPILANIYLHHVIDLWVIELKKFFHDEIDSIRYADDLVFVMKNEEEAKRLYATLPKRLAKYGLEMAAEKSSIVPCGTWNIDELIRKKRPVPKFKFLGFEVMWRRLLKPNRLGRPIYVPRVKPRLDRMNNRLRDIRTFLKKNLNNGDHMSVLRSVKRVVDGWTRYFGVSDCGDHIWNFRNQVKRALHHWFNRRGKRGSMTWRRLGSILASIKFDEYIPLTQLYPNKTEASRRQ